MKRFEKENKNKCRSCGSQKVKTRKNYTHGKNSRPVITKVCKRCNTRF